MVRYYKGILLGVVALACCAILLSGGNAADPKTPVVNKSAALRAALQNPNIDMDGYLRISMEAAKHRETRRVTEEDFIKMSAEKGVVILDARSKEKYDMLHIKDAVNLSFPDIAVASLKEKFSDKDATILIYCNNNFRNAEKAMATKLPVASLNLSTYIALYSYGYRNIYELAPQIDPKQTKLPMIGKAE